jgi:hypothetical protein
LANLGRKQSDEQKARYKRHGENNSHWGKKHTPEAKAKISVKARQRIGAKNPFYGKTHTKETREKMVAAWKRRKVIIRDKKVQDVQGIIV